MIKIHTRLIARIAPIVLLGAAMVGCAGAGEPKAEGPPLSGDEIRQLISGNTVSGAILAQQFQFYYQADGKVSGAIDTVNDDTGTWQIKDGNTYCHQWITFFDGVERCYQWVPLAGGRYRMGSVSAYHGEGIEVWKIEHGNPLGF